MIKNRLRVTLLISACIAVIWWAGGAQAGELGVEYGVDLVSKYVWRGLVANPDAAIQPSLTLSFGSGSSLNLWGSLDATDSAGAKGKFTEMDYTLSQEFVSSGRECSAGIIYYDFPNTSFAGTTELFAEVALGGSYDAGLSVYWDLDQANGMYASYHASRSMPMGNRSLAITGSVGIASSGYNQYYFGESKVALVDAVLGLVLPLHESEGSSASIVIRYSVLMDYALRRAVASPDNFVAGLSVSGSF